MKRHLKTLQLAGLGRRSRRIMLVSLTLAASLLFKPQRLWADELWANEPALNPLPVDNAAVQETRLEQVTRLEIDISRRRLTLYQGATPIKSYAIAVGRRGWQTPIGSFQVMQMMRDPAWMNPLTRVVTAGGDPANPLGHYWIGFWTDGQNWVGMHGTPNPESVGQAASHGCIRLYNQDIQELFAQVTVGTPVTVIP